MLLRAAVEMRFACGERAGGIAPCPGVNAPRSVAPDLQLQDFSRPPSSPRYHTFDAPVGDQP